jgi:cytochrome c-type biogenesis protein CcmH/NrfG
MLRDRQVDFIPDQQLLSALRTAGAEPNLLSLVRGFSHSSPSVSETGCPAALIQIAKLSHEQDFSSAEELTRAEVRAHQQDVNLHLLLGYLLRQQNHLDEAFDAYADAKEVDPGIPEVHTGLAHVFFGSNDAENTIAEARTALSIDPQDGEAHRLLGLGLFLDDKYEAAMNAFEEALIRDPRDAEAYYGIGMTERALGQLNLAAQAFQRSTQIDPDFGDAQSELQKVLAEISEKQKVSSAVPQPSTGLSGPGTGH